MASTFTTLLRLERMAQGENDNTWGDKSSDAESKIERAIAGRIGLTLASSDVTLTENSGGSGTSEQAVNMILDCTGALSAPVNIIAPNVSKLYIIANSTTNAFAVSIKTSGGAALEIPQGETYLVWCDGSDVFETINANVTGTVALATNALQLGGIVAANYARFAIKNTWANPQIVAGNVRTLTANAYTPDADTDTLVIIRQSEIVADYTINNPTGTPVEGQIMTFNLEQHDTTPRNVTWGSQFIFTADSNLNVTQTVDTVDKFTAQYDLGLDRWMVAGAAQNFPRA